MTPTVRVRPEWSPGLLPEDAPEYREMDKPEDVFDPDVNDEELDQWVHKAWYDILGSD